MKNLKNLKKFFVILVLFYFSTNITNAGQCSIENWSSSSVSNYLKNLDKLIENITNEAKNKKIASEEKSNNFLSWFLDYAKQTPYYSQYDYATRIYNDVFNMENTVKRKDSLFEFIDFFETPDAVQRDIQDIRKRNYKLYNLNSFIWDKKLHKVQAWNVCSGVQNCNFSWDFSEILTNTIKNNNNIERIILKTTAGEAIDTKAKKWELPLQLIDKNFFDDLITNYWPEAIETCNEENENSYLNRIKEKIEKIWNNESWEKQLIKKWWEAIDLLSWIFKYKDINLKEKERALLKRELNKQWVPLDTQKNMYDALEKFNENSNFVWFSLANNPISNTAKSVWNTVEHEWLEWWNDRERELFENYARKSKDVSITEINKNLSNSIETTKTRQDIKEMYSKLKSTWAQSEINWNNLETRIINIHTNLSDVINTLEKTCKISVEICNSQATWLWSCWDCNW